MFENCGENAIFQSYLTSEQMIIHCIKGTGNYCCCHVISFIPSTDAHMEKGYTRLTHQACFNWAMPASYLSNNNNNNIIIVECIYDVIPYFSVNKQQCW